MKKFFYTLLLLACTSQALLAQNLPANDRIPFKSFKALKEYFSKNYRHKAPLIMAHRGGTGKGLPENSLLSFKYTHSRLPWALLEMDIQPSSDDSLLIFHDDSVNRVTDGSGLLKNMTFKEARALKLKDTEGHITNERIPTFREVLNWNKNRALLVLDIKRGTDIGKVMAIVKKANAENNTLYILYSIEDAKKVYEKNKEVMIALGFNSREGIEAIKNSGLPFDHLVALTPRQEQEKNFYDTIHSMGILVCRDEGAALNAPSAEARKTLYRQLFENGTDIIVTFDPLFVDHIF